MGSLERDAWQVLIGNWRRGSTVPCPGLYPHQWSWDSAFVAFGLRHLSPLRAQRELESLFGAQWRDGRVPHIVFDPLTPPGAYFPGPDVWRSDLVAGAPAVPTSALIQPPVHAWAVWETFRADPAQARARGFLPRLYPRLLAWHEYLRRHRDLGGEGLLACVHPWETGMDNSPSWDEPLAEVEPVPEVLLCRADLAHTAAGERPTDKDYGRYLRLVLDYRDGGYVDHAVPHRFAVEDPLSNALLVVSELALARIAEEIGVDPEPHRRSAAHLSEVLATVLFDGSAGMFFARDVRTGRLIRRHTIGGLLPLLVPGLPVADDLVKAALSDRFRLTESCPLPSYDLTASDHEPNRYWRGPGWVNTSWLFWRGLLQHGQRDLADDLRDRLLGRIRRSGFREYFDTVTGAGRGTDRFSWTAALTLDLIHNSPEDLAVTRATSRVGSGGALPGGAGVGPPGDRDLVSGWPAR